jgi:hypothetical protein
MLLSQHTPIRHACSSEIVWNDAVVLVITELAQNRSPQTYYDRRRSLDTHLPLRMNELALEGQVTESNRGRAETLRRQAIQLVSNKQQFSPTYCVVNTCFIKVRDCRQ